MEYSSIHGRFQPFHNAHLAYALAALQQADRLYIGLTKVLTEESIDRSSAPHRFQPEENPLTYFQRTHVITRALVAAGVAATKFDIGPFPIEVPTRLTEFWPTNGPCFTTNVAAWNEQKIAILQELGYKVSVLNLDLLGQAVTSGSSIRQLFRAGDNTWRRYVPTGTAECLDENNWSL